MFHSWKPGYEKTFDMTDIVLKSKAIEKTSPTSLLEPTEIWFFTDFFPFNSSSHGFSLWQRKKNLEKPTHETSPNNVFLLLNVSFFFQPWYITKHKHLLTRHARTERKHVMLLFTIPVSSYESIRNMYELLLRKTIREPTDQRHKNEQHWEMNFKTIHYGFSFFTCVKKTYKIIHAFECQRGQCCGQKPTESVSLYSFFFNPSQEEDRVPVMFVVDVQQNKRKTTAPANFVNSSRDGPPLNTLPNISHVNFYKPMTNCKKLTQVQKIPKIQLKVWGRPGVLNWIC
jgi:hypothetical protein